MKKHVSTIILLLFTCALLTAQEHKKKKEKIRAYKISYLTQELDLSTNVAQNFWPIYNKYEKKLDDLRDLGRTEIRKKLKNAGGLEALTEKEAKSFVNTKLDLDKKILIEKEQFLLEISKILPYKKILKLQLSEREFARKLMRKYSKKQN